MTTKEALHRLIEELPDDALPGVERYLAAVRDDPMMRVLMAAPLDDEPTSPEEDADARRDRALSSRRFRNGRRRDISYLCHHAGRLSVALAPPGLKEKVTPRLCRSSMSGFKSSPPTTHSAPPAALLSIIVDCGSSRSRRYATTSNG